VKHLTQDYLINLVIITENIAISGKVTR